MAKFTITISDEAHPILKQWAEKDCRSLTSYLTVLLDNLTGVQPRTMYLPVDITHVSEKITVPGMQFIPHDTPGGFRTPENPTNAPILTSDTTTYYKKRKEIL